jgi:hypothetical protein
MSSNTQVFTLYTISFRSIMLLSKVFGQCISRLPFYTLISLDPIMVFFIFHSIGSIPSSFLPLSLLVLFSLFLLDSLPGSFLPLSLWFAFRFFFFFHLSYIPSSFLSVSNSYFRGARGSLGPI